jgi:exocyst complex component 6
LTIPLGDTVADYLASSNRQTTYGAVKSKRLQAVLEKLARYGGSQRDAASREAGEKRRKQADAVGRIYPGEGR